MLRSSGDYQVHWTIFHTNSSNVWKGCGYTPHTVKVNHLQSLNERLLACGYSEQSGDYQLPLCHNCGEPGTTPAPNIVDKPRATFETIFGFPWMAENCFNITHFFRSARTSYSTFDPVPSRNKNSDHLYSLINHCRTIVNL